MRHVIVAPKTTDRNNIIPAIINYFYHYTFIQYYTFLSLLLSGSFRNATEITETIQSYLYQFYVSRLIN